MPVSLPGVAGVLADGPHRAGGRPAKRHPHFLGGGGKRRLQRLRPGGKTRRPPGLLAPAGDQRRDDPGPPAERHAGGVVRSTAPGGDGRSLTAAIAALACSRLMDQHDFSQAAQTLAGYLEGDNAILGLHQFLMTCDLVCCRLLAGGGPEVLSPLEDPVMKKLAKAMKDYPAVLRTQYFRALLAEDDPDGAAAALETFASVARTFPYPGEIAGERELMDLAQNNTKTR